MMNGKIKDLSGKEWNKEYIVTVVNEMTEQQAKDALIEMIKMDTSILGAISKAMYGHYRVFA